MQQQKSTALAENQVKDLLKKYGIKTTKYTLAKEKKELQNINLKFPLALKVCSANILHKTDVKGVKLNIQNKEELAKEFEEMQRRFPKENFLIEEMEEKGIEIIIGLINDATFGISIMFGLGGIFTEVFNDVTFRVVPIERYDAEQMLNELKGKKLLEGFRGMKVNREEIINLLLNVSKIAQDMEGKLVSLDLNPVFARENDAVVVDAKLILKG